MMMVKNTFQSEVERRLDPTRLKSLDLSCNESTDLTMVVKLKMLSMDMPSASAICCSMMSLVLSVGESLVSREKSIETERDRVPMAVGIWVGVGVGNMEGMGEGAGIGTDVGAGKGTAVGRGVGRGEGNGVGSGVG
jgi:hypothetical protein